MNILELIILIIEHQNYNVLCLVSILIVALNHFRNSLQGIIRLSYQFPINYYQYVKLIL